MQRKFNLGLGGVNISRRKDEYVFELQFSSPVKDRIVGDLTQILDQLDCLKLSLAGVHLASAIHAIQNEDVSDQVY